MLPGFALPAIAGGAACALLVASSAAAQGIYTCVDAKGRRLTSDRPIAECTDRVQRELRHDGTVRRQIPPEPTAVEREAREEQRRKQAEADARVAEEQRKERALVTRFPNAVAHDRERQEALAQADEQIALAGRRLKELAEQRKKLDTEMEFYAADPGKAPANLRRQLDENQASVEERKTFVASQEAEKKRINARFDDELARLKVLWAQRAAAASKAY